MNTILRILHVSNFDLTPKAPGYLGVHFKISNGLTRLGHYVLNFGDRELARHLNIFKARKLGVRQVNKKLLTVVESFKPDLIIFGHADTISADTIEIIRKNLPGVRIIQWNVDPLFEKDNVRRINSKIDHVDLTMCTTSGPLLEELSQGKYNVGFFGNPTDTSIETNRNFEKDSSELKFDIGLAIGNPNEHRFIGGQDYIASDFLDEIQGISPNISCCFPGYKHEKITGIEYENFLKNTSMSINLSRRNDVKYYSSDRISQTIGNGILTFVDRETGYTDFFDEDEIPFFSSINELKEKILLFKEDDKKRKETSQKGWEKYVKIFNEKSISKKIVKMAYQNV